MRINTPLTIRESPQYGPGTGQAFNIFLESENQLNKQSMKTKSERVCSGHQQLQVNTKEKSILSMGGGDGSENYALRTHDSGLSIHV